MKPDLSLIGRYKTIWPALSTRVAWWWCQATVRGCEFGRPTWLRITTSTVLATVPVLLIVTAWAIVACLFVLWPFGWLAMLPTRIAVKRGVAQLGVVYLLCWLFFVPFAWIVALVLAVRDPQRVAA
jgi:hypothetical protein